MLDPVVITYCAKSKSDLKAGFPFQLYTSQRMKTFFSRFAEMKRMILSYKYGIIEEDRIVDNYEQSKFGENYPALCAVVKVKLTGKYVLFYSPRKLTEGPWIKLLEDANINYRIVRSYKEVEKELCLRNQN